MSRYNEIKADFSEVITPDENQPAPVYVLPWGSIPIGMPIQIQPRAKPNGKPFAVIKLAAHAAFSMKHMKIISLYTDVNSSTPVTVKQKHWDKYHKEGIVSTTFSNLRKYAPIILPDGMTAYKTGSSYMFCPETRLTSRPDKETLCVTTAGYVK